MRVVSLINMKGGVAKTTLSVNIADCLATRHDQRVLLIDVDPQFNATQCLVPPEHYMEHLSGNGDTILNVFDRSARVQASTVGSNKPVEPKNLEDIEPLSLSKKFDLLPGNLELHRLEMAPGDGREHRLRNYLHTVSDEYDHVIIDTPPTPSIWMTSALIASNHYLIPVKADPISLTGIELLKNIIDEKKENFGLDLQCAGLVLTVTESNTRVYERAKTQLEEDTHWSQHLYPVTLPKRVAIAQNQLEQISILDGDKADAKTAITRITDEYLNRVEDND